MHIITIEKKQTGKGYLYLAHNQNNKAIFGSGLTKYAALADFIYCNQIELGIIIQEVSNVPDKKTM